MDSIGVVMRALTSRLKDNLNFWKMSTNSISGGGLALMDSMPSPMSFFFDFLFLQKKQVQENFRLEAKKGRSK
jgi:hypothetical protein